MDASFWHAKWERNEIGFHGSEAHSLLVDHFDALGLPPGSRIFLPLCGKTLDIHWLLAQGHRVVGAELSPLAIQQLFAELDVEPTVSRVGALERYSTEDLDVYVGDIFEVTAELLGPVDAVYDRAALVALPPAMRPRYTAHLAAITLAAPQLLICFEYDQRQHAGPPFSIDADEVRQHYADRFDLTRLAQIDVAGGLKGKCPATESVWLLRKG
ncbi:thiopurine S-methyltransferase [Aromatoleum petrolei]|uniref:Thiopurine S-methyltransferase n=1 Tax=Aromatoleum petrolei TaxID=76116 RepID=A0ABX1MV07_9RHOO|nr:thiopurine S-methyltransferase [Aromatoleum petrolei]NMF90433.1 thiopurine S-methyltransferase [Aromatoleum petrolei]QTQ36832.1 Thiopurine S-methyltransferase [Aromatoleum petrolei]